MFVLDQGMCTELQMRLREFWRRVEQAHALLVLYVSCAMYAVSLCDVSLCAVSSRAVLCESVLLCALLCALTRITACTVKIVCAPHISDACTHVHLSVGVEAAVVCRAKK
jgi:hypothetical protein